MYVPVSLVLAGVPAQLFKDLLVYRASISDMLYVIHKEWNINDLHTYEGSKVSNLHFDTEKDSQKLAKSVPKIGTGFLFLVFCLHDLWSLEHVQG